MHMPDVIFPHLGIEIQHLSRVAFSIAGFEINWYGLLVALGILVGAVAAFRNVKENGIKSDMFMDFILIAVPVCIICTRLYYVIFSWDEYSGDLMKIFAFRDGGMGVYGGIISGIVTAVIFSKVKKISLGALGDTGAFGLMIGQVIGRWGNFINQEAFGDYTNSFLAMRLKLSNVANAHVTEKMLDNSVVLDGIRYIQVHPTFFYESMWNLALFIGLWIYRKHKKFKGEILAFYVLGYGIGRFWIESLRTDQLMLFGTKMPVSQLVSAIIAAAALAFLIYNWLRISKSTPKNPESETGADV